jgi:hypothetical protein
MTTNLDIIRAALQTLGVLPEAKEPSAEQAAHALEVLNDFLEDWSASGIDVGQWPQTDLTASFPAASDVQLTAKAHLAVQLAPYYERPIHPVTAGQAQKGYARLLRIAVLAQLEPVSTDHMPVGEEQGITCAASRSPSPPTTSPPAYRRGW